MHTSVVKLRPENIVELAKDVIRPAGWYCEWNVATLQKPQQCRVVLNSWSAYYQHLLRHCQQGKGGHTNALVCRLPRCNIPSGISISSINELVTHIQQSHLSRVQLTCPVRDCRSFSFSRTAVLELHFREVHLDLINQEVPLYSPLLLPTWRPFYPDCSVEPPPLPQKAPPGSGLIPPAKGTVRRNFETQESQQSQESLRDDEIMGSQLLSPKKCPRRQIDIEQPPVEPDSEPTIDFDDLTPYNGELETFSLIRHTGPPLDVSRPQDILDPKEYGYCIPQGTILYDNFVRIHGLEGGDNNEEAEKDA